MVTFKEIKWFNYYLSSEYRKQYEKRWFFFSFFFLNLNNILMTFSAFGNGQLSFIARSASVGNRIAGSQYSHRTDARPKWKGRCERLWRRSESYYTTIFIDHKFWNLYFIVILGMYSASRCHPAWRWFFGAVSDGQWMRCQSDVKSYIWYTATPRMYIFGEIQRGRNI